VTVGEDSIANSIMLTGSDLENQPLTFILLSQPAHGTLSGTAPNLTYTPAANYSGADSFTFKVNDGADSNIATVSITVSPANDRPVANPDVVSTPVLPGQTIEIAVLANDTDIDDPPSALTVGAITTSPAHGTAAISSDGKKINYTASATFAGADTFRYTAKDPSGTSSDPAMVTVTENLGFIGLLGGYQPPPRAYNSGSALPLVWQYVNSAGQAIESSWVAPMLFVKFNQLVGANPNNCSGGSETGIVQINQDFPGNSNFQYFTAANPHPTAGANTWQFNWQLVSPVVPGCWKARVILDLNHNGIPGDAGDQMNQPNGFLIKIR
jgi:hypothetical protein